MAIEQYDFVQLALIRHWQTRTFKRRFIRLVVKTNWRFE